MLSALAMAACAGPPGEALTWRESWELLGLTETGDVIDARFSLGNTGVLRGQAQARMDRWIVGGGEVQIRAAAVGPDVQVPPDRLGIQVGEAAVTADATGAVVRVVADHGGGVVRLTHMAPVGPSTAWLAPGGQWTVVAQSTHAQLGGVIESGAQGGLARGHGVLLHRGGDGWQPPQRDTVCIINPRLAICVDQYPQGRLAWAAVDGVLLDATDARLSWPDQGPATIDFRPAADLVASIEPHAPGGLDEPLGHLYGVEQLVATVVGGAPTRTTQAATATLSLQGQTWAAPALMVRVRP